MLQEHEKRLSITSPKVKDLTAFRVNRFPPLISTFPDLIITFTELLSKSPASAKGATNFEYKLKSRTENGIVTNSKLLSCVDFGHFHGGFRFLADEIF